MELPEKFKFLYEHGPLPKVLAIAFQYMGIHEIKGSENNPVIMDMAKGLGIGDIYISDDKQAWCAVFGNHCLRLAGKPIDLHPKDRYDLMRALKTANLPEYEIVPRGQERAGDLVRLKREDGGHNTFWIAETPNNRFIGFGGNQGNAVGFAEFDSDRIESVRRYYKTGIPESAQHYKMDSTGKLSTNEA
jgi:uncharacterized protein (TIGR02594 family)